jgi:hypothetical protein
MATIHFATAALNAALNAAFDLVDAGSGAGVCKIYSGAVPANGNSDPAGTMLATVTLNDPGFDAAASANKDLDLPAAANAAASGTAGCCVFEDSAGNNVLVGDVTATGGGGMIELVTTTIVSGQPVQITAFNGTAGPA